MHALTTILATTSWFKSLPSVKRVDRYTAIRPGSDNRLTFIVHLLVSFCAFSAPQLVWSQDVSQPIRIQQAAAATPQKAGTTFRLENTGPKPIAGYVLRIQTSDASGAPAVRISDMRLLNAGPNAKAKSQGESWNHHFRGTVNAPQVAVTVDYILFEDGSHWGPNALGQGGKLEGMRQGWDSALLQLRQLMSEKGSQAVADYLGALK